MNQKEILKNFDVLTFKQWTAEEIKQYPSLEKAQKSLQNQYVRDDENHPYSLGCDLSEFKKYGPGVYLAFRFLKYMLVVMGCLLVFPITNLAIFILSQEQFDGTNMETIFQTTTLSSLQHPNRLVIGFNFIVLVGLTLSLLYWRHLQTEYVLQCTKEKALTSYFTVILTKIPNYYCQNDLKQYLEKYYGKVTDIYTPKNYQEDLNHYQELSNVINQYKKEREIYLRDKKHRNCFKMVENFIKFKEMHQQLSHTIVANKKYQPYCAFVTFQTVQARNKLLEDSEKQSGWCNKKEESKKQQFLYEDQVLQFKACQIEPQGILWENLNVPKKQKIIRCTLIIFLLGAFLMIAISLFFVLAAAEASLYHDDFDLLEESEILISGDPEKIRSLCIELGSFTFSSYPECEPYFSDYIKYFILYLTFPVVVTVLKIFFSMFMTKLVKYRRHKYQFYKIHWEVIIITLFYFMKMGLIKWFMYRSFSLGGIHLELLTVFRPFLNLLANILPIRPDKIHLFHDFDGEWVAHASHKVILIGFFSFNFSILLYHFSKYLIKRYRQSQAQNKLTQSEMNQELKGHQFDFQFIYAEMLALFLFCMLYYPCMPIIYLAVFSSLLLLYWVIKYKFVRLDSKPAVYSHSISEVATKIMLFGLAINALVSPLYFAGLEQQDHPALSEILIDYWYYFIVFAVIVVFGLFRIQTLKLYYSLKNFCFQCVSSTYTKQFYETKLIQMKAVTTKNSHHSYSMYENPKYSQLLKTLFLLNRTEIHHFAYIPRDQIQEIKQSLNRDQNSFKLFDQLYQILLSELKRSEQQKDNMYALDVERCQEYLRKMEEIREEVKKQILEEDEYYQFTKSINAKIKEIDSKRKEQLSNSIKGPNLQDLFEEGLQTGTRMQSTL